VSDSSQNDNDQIILNKLIQCKVTVIKKKGEGKKLTYNNCASSAELMNQMEDLVDIVLDNRDVYSRNAEFLNSLKSFKKGFLTEKNKRDDVKYIWHRHMEFISAKDNKPIAPTPKLFNQAAPFIAIHRSLIVNLIQELKNN
jgi:hypothetical protein